MDIFKRIIICICAVFFLGLGIALTTSADLGTSPISSVPYVLSLITPLSFGVTTVIINIAFFFNTDINFKRGF